MPDPAIALITCADVPDLDAEGRLLIDALQAAGARPRIVVWDDPDVDWSAFDLAVIRATWDYMDRREEFLAWADRAAALTQLENPPPTLRWTTDKHYLADLAAAGIPTVPSVFVAPGEDPDHELLGGEHVVKPTVGAGSRGAMRFTAEDVARSRAYTADLTSAGQTALIQPYLAEIDLHGETGIVTFEGEVSHAFRKAAILTPCGERVEGLHAPETITSRTPSEAELDLAHRAIAASTEILGADGPPLYGRIDLLPTPDGPRLLELELCEPSFFLDTAPDQAPAVARAFISRAARSEDLTPMTRRPST